MDASYITALETRARWLQWAITKGHKAWSDVGLKYIPGLNSYIKCLEEGDTYFMNRHFCNLVENARSTVPDDLVFENTWMQSPQGFLWCEQPFSVPSTLGPPGSDDSIFEKGFPLKITDAYKGQTTRTTTLGGKPIKIAALGWVPVPEGLKTANYMAGNKAGRVAGPGAYQFLCFQNFANLADVDLTSRHVTEGFGCWSYFMLQEGDKVIDRIKQFEAGASQEGGAYIGRDADMLHEIRWVYSAMYLMAQRMGIIVHHDTDRATRRRAERDNRPVTPYIKVISLRRYEEDKKKAETTGKHIDYQWQWEVRGHWRNQWYPSTHEYKQVFIEAYIKGPQDKPLKPVGQKIFVARR